VPARLDINLDELERTFPSVIIPIRYRPINAQSLWFFADEQLFKIDRAFEHVYGK